MIAAAGARSGHGQAHGKAILIGEHWVLTGCEAIALALPTWWTRVEWSDDGPLHLTSDGGDLIDSTSLQMLGEAAAQLGVAADGAARVSSNLPMHRGFGSSAAFAVAALRALASRLGRPLDDDSLLQAARAVEAIAHGRSSGLDPAAAMSSGGAVRFAGGRRLSEITISAALATARWVLCDVGRAPPTATAVAIARAARTTMTSSQDEALQRSTAEAARSAAVALRDGDASGLGAAMNAAGDALEPLGVVSPAMRRAIDALRAAGALGVKQSGAGLGGAILALAPDPALAATLCAAVAGCTAERWVLPVVAETAPTPLEAGR